MSLTIHPISSGILLLYIIVLSSATANKRISLSLSQYGEYEQGSDTLKCKLLENLRVCSQDAEQSQLARTLPSLFTNSQLAD